MGNKMVKIFFNLIGVIILSVCFTSISDASSETRQLVEAIRNGNMNDVERLFKTLDEREKNREIKGFLYASIDSGQKSIARFFVDNGADINEASYGSGNTLLHRWNFKDAEGKERVEKAEVLIACGADVNARNANG
ncbi:MAG: hypothetical protein ABIH66_06670 [bacterium]